MFEAPCYSIKINLQNWSHQFSLLPHNSHSSSVKHYEQKTAKNKSFQQFLYVILGTWFHLALTTLCPCMRLTLYGAAFGSFLFLSPLIKSCEAISFWASSVPFLCLCVSELLLSGYKTEDWMKCLSIAYIDLLFRMPDKHW